MKEACLRYFKHPLTWLLLAGFVIRIFGIGFGLPHHLIGDEEAEIFGALKMVELKTLLPVFHANEFQGLLYYPPFLCYLYLLLFVPVLLVQYVVLGFPALLSFQQQLMFDSSWLWYAARFSSVLFGLANVYLIYRLALVLFKDAQVALCSAALFNLSFFAVTLSHVARHWMPGLFFSLLGMLMAIKALEQCRNRLLVAAGVSFGISFGISYLVFYFPIIAVVFFYHTRSNYKLLLRQFIYFLVPFVVVAGIALLAYPQPFIQQIFLHRVGDSGATKTITRSVIFYMTALWNYEPLLFIFGIIGTIRLWFKKRSLAIFLLSSCLFLGAVVYVFFWNIPRYLIPLLPFIAALAGYGLCDVFQIMYRRSRYMAAVLVLCIVVYVALLFGRYNWLLLQGDTRLSAVAWLETTVSSQDSALIYSERVRPVPTAVAINEQQSISPASIRSRERSVLLDPSRSISDSQLRAYNIFYVTSREERDKLIEVSERGARRKYLVVDSWTVPDPLIDVLRSDAATVTAFVGSDVVAGSDIPEGGGGSFIGGESHTLQIPLLVALWRIVQFGPTVTVYRLL